MSDEKINRLIEEIGKVLAKVVYDSGELQDLLAKIKKSGYNPMIAIEAKLSLFKDSDEVGTLLHDIADLSDDKIDHEKDFNDLVTSEDQEFLKSIHIKIE